MKTALATLMGLIAAPALAHVKSGAHVHPHTEEVVAFAALALVAGTFAIIRMRG